jgi:hypothetical protein
MPEIYDLRGRISEERGSISEEQSFLRHPASAFPRNCNGIMPEWTEETFGEPANGESANSAGRDAFGRMGSRPACRQRDHVSVRQLVEFWGNKDALPDRNCAAVPHK